MKNDTRSEVTDDEEKEKSAEPALITIDNQDSSSRKNAHIS